MRFLFLVPALFLGLIACGGGATTQADLNPPASETTIEGMPDWMVNPPEDPDFLFGPATATSRDLQLAINKAQAEGRTQIAQQLEMRFTSLTKRFQEEIAENYVTQFVDQFTQTYKQVTSEALLGTRSRDQVVEREGAIYRVYVLMEMPLGPASAGLVSRIRSHQDMYTRIGSTEAFAELEREAERYDAERRRSPDRSL